MGITVYCKKTKNCIDLGYGGFSRLRNKVAELSGEPFGSHYLRLSSGENISYEEFDKRTLEMLESKQADVKIVDFLLQSDCGGKIHYGACKNILKVIGDYDDNILYGYCGLPDCAKFADFKKLLQECVENKCDLVWV